MNFPMQNQFMMHSMNCPKSHFPGGLLETFFVALPSDPELPRSGTRGFLAKGAQFNQRFPFGRNTTLAPGFRVHQ